MPLRCTVCMVTFGRRTVDVPVRIVELVSYLIVVCGIYCAADGSSEIRALPFSTLTPKNEHDGPPGRMSKRFLIVSRRQRTLLVRYPMTAEGSVVACVWNR